MKKFFFFFAAVMCASSMSFAQNTPVIPLNDNGWLHYDDGNPYSQYSINTWGVVFQAGVFQGSLSKVKVYIAALHSTNEMTLTVYGGTNTPNVNWVKKHSQIFAPGEEHDWLTIALETPISFAEDESCWIVLSAPEGTIASAQMSETNEFPGVSWRRLDDGTWSSVSYRAFMIRAYFETWAFPENTIYSWDFEDGTEGWNGTEDNTKWLWGTGDKFESRGSHSGTYNFKRLSNEGAGGLMVDMLVSPELDLSNYTDVKLGFWRLQRPWTGDLDTLTIYYRPSEFANWMPLVTYKDDVEKWTLKEGIKLKYLSPTYQIGFEYRDGYGFGIGLDDIYITGTRLPDPDDSEPDGEKLTVHEGGTVCGYIPYETFDLDSYTRSQYLLSNEDLTAMRDMSVNAIRWYSSNELHEFPDYSESRFDIYLKEVDYTALTAFETKGNDDIIYQGAIIPSRTSNGEVLVTIVLDKPFVYHGGNLLIGCDNTVKGTAFATRFWGFSYYPDEIAIYGYSNVSLEDVSIRQAYFLPKTTFYYTEPTDLEEVNAAANLGSSSKLLHDGHLYILRDGHIFNAQGARVK